MSVPIMLVFPRMIAPHSSSFWIGHVVFFDMTKSLSFAARPKVVRYPARSDESLIAVGTPSSNPSDLPAA